MENSCVLPGSFIVTEEEFESGKNAFGSNGKVYSDTVGKADLDMATRIAAVKKSVRNVESLDIDSVVIGTVEKNKEQASFIKIISAEKNGLPRAVGNSSANLPVFNIANFYVNDIKEMLRIGDVVKAKVVEITPFRVVLSIKEPELGVIKAFCTKCRSSLVQEGRDFKCKCCGNIETRKAASSYFSL